jgi:hypothetical protein
MRIISRSNHKCDKLVRLIMNTSLKHDRRKKKISCRIKIGQCLVVVGLRG